MEDSWILADSFYDPAREDFNIAESSKHVISNFAHLSLLKNQRNELRRALKEEKLSHAERKQAVASLRRLSLRLAAQAAAKDRKINEQSQALSAQRKQAYLKDREYEEKVEEADHAIAALTRQKAMIVTEWQHATELLRQYTTVRTSPTTPKRGKVSSLSGIPSPPSSPSWSPRSSRTGTLESSDISIRSLEASGTFQAEMTALREQSNQAITACRLVVESASRDRDSHVEQAEVLRSANEKLLSAAEAYEAKISSLEDSKSILSSTIDSIESQLEASQNDNRRLTQLHDTQNNENRINVSHIEKLEHCGRQAEGHQKSLRSELAASRMALLQLERDHERMQVDLRMLHCCISSHQKQLEASQAEATKSKEGWAQSKQAADKLRGKFREAEAQLEVKTEEGRKLREQAVELSTQLETTQFAHTTLAQRHADLFAKFEQAQASAEKKAKDQAALVSELEAANASVRDLKTTRSDAETRLSTAVQQSEEYRRTVTELRSRIEMLHSQYESVKIERAQIKNLLESSQSDVEARGKAIECFTSTIISLRMENGLFQQSLAESEARLQQDEVLRAKLAEIENGKVDLKIAVRKAVQELAAMREPFAALEAAKKVLETEVQSVRKEIKVARGVIASLKGSQVSVEQTLKKLEAEKSNLQDQLAALRTQLTVSANDRRELESAKRAVEDRETRLTEELRVVRQELDNSREALDRAKTANAELDSERSILRNDLTSLRTLFGKMENEMDSLSASHGQMESTKMVLEADIVALRGDLESSQQQSGVLMAARERLELDKASLEKEKDTLKKRIDETEKQTQASLSSLHRELDDAKVGMIELKSANARLATSKEALEADAKAIRLDLCSVRQELNSTRNSCYTLEGSKAKVEVQLSELQVAHTRLERDFGDAIRKLQEAKSANKSLERKIRDLETRLAASLDDRKQLERSVERLNSELKESHIGIRSLKEELQIIAKAKAELQVEIREARSQEKTLHAQIKTLETSQDNLRSQLSDSQKVQYDLQQELGGLRHRCSSLESELQDATHSYKNSDGMLARLREEKADLKQQLRDAQQSSASLTQLLNDADAERHVLNGSFERTIEELRMLRDETIPDLRKQIQAVRDAESGVRADMQDTIVERRDVEAQLQRLHERHASVELELVESQRKTMSVESSLRTLQGDLEYTRKLKVTAEEGQDQARDSLREAEATSASLDVQLRKSLEENRRLYHQSQQSQEALVKARNDHSVISQAKIALEDELRSVRNQLSSYQTDLRSSNADLRTLRRSNSNLQETHKSLVAKFKESNTRLDEAYEENEAKTTLLQDAQSGLGNAETAIAQCETQLDSYIEQANLQLGERDAKIMQLRFELASASAQLEEAQSVQQTFEDAMTTQKSTTDDWEVRYNDLTHDLQSSNQARELSEKQNADLRAHNDDLKRQLHSLENTVRNLQSPQRLPETPPPSSHARLSPATFNASPTTFKKPHLSPQFPESPSTTRSRRIATPSTLNSSPRDRTVDIRTRPHSSYYHSSAEHGLAASGKPSLAHSAAGTAWKAQKKGKSESGFAKLRRSVLLRLK